MLGLPILIKQGKSKQSAVAANYYDDASTTLVHEVKRVGFLIDRYVDLQLRVGDFLIVYLQRTAA